MRRLLGAFLIVEAALAALSTLQSLPALPGYDPIAVALILARAAVGALQLSSGFLLVEKRPAGPALGQAALLASAIVTTLTVGYRLAPSDVYYWIRWQFVAGYWAYAVGGIWLLRGRS
ncbi:MAG TPA: hypothetical protein VES67_23505 [Vicinamibacterales bacterium]|nr:hypothetical protein [Vicinamibacterales bacterium]